LAKTQNFWKPKNLPYIIKTLQLGGKKERRKKIRKAKTRSNPYSSQEITYTIIIIIISEEEQQALYYKYL
jgi:hypothetical protein